MTHFLLFLILVAIVVPGLIQAVAGVLLISTYLIVSWLFRGLLIAAGLGLVWWAVMNPTEGPAIVVLMLTTVLVGFYVVAASRWLWQRFTAVAAARPTGTTSG
jgi:hypothetical protein